MRSFDIPEFYRSPIISRVKAKRKSLDPRKQDFRPSELDFGNVRIRLARHFGFCFGVENAIEISTNGRMKIAEIRNAAVFGSTPEKRAA